MESSFHAFPFTKCVGLPFRTLPGPTPPRITVKELSWLVQTSPGLWNNLPSPFALLSHKSHCLKRKCSSTLAAETQIMSEALAEVEWIRGLFEEMTNPKFSIVEWAARSRNRGLLIDARIGDAKSLYDHLRTETSVVPTTGGRRLASKSSGPAWTHKVQWYVGLITVVCMLQMLLRTGRICITEESITLEKHKSNPSSRNSSSKTHIYPVTQAVMGAEY